MPEWASALFPTDLENCTVAQPTDIVIIVSDHHRWDIMANSGCQLVHTPNLDALASSGTSFQRAATVYPDASAAYCALVSGTYPESTSVTFASSAMGAMLAGRGYIINEVAAAQTLSATVQAACSDIAAGSGDRRAMMIRLPPIGSFEDIPERCFLPYRGNGVPLASYFAAVTAYDEAVGTIISAIENAGRRRDTLVIYTSLSGEQFKARDFVNHANTLHAESIRVPLIVSWPAAVGVGISDAFVSLLDIFGTLARCTGGDVLATSNLDLLDLNRGGQPELGRQALYLHNRHHRHINVVFKDGTASFVIFPYWEQRGLWTERYKLILSADGGICSFFDLRIDPEEEFNLFALPQQTPQGLLDQFSSRREAVVETARQMAAEAQNLGDGLGVELAAKVIADPTYGLNPTYELI